MAMHYGELLNFDHFRDEIIVLIISLVMIS